MENTRENKNTPFRKLLRLVLFHQGSETGFTLLLDGETNSRRKSYTQASVSQTRQGPANSTWPVHQGSGLAVTLNSEWKMAIYCTPCPLHYGGHGSCARNKGKLGLLGFLYTRQMASLSGSDHFCGVVPKTCSYSLCLPKLPLPSPPPSPSSNH